jgi:hypothetical protein
MKKCKTCKYWTPQNFKLGSCSGIFPTSTIIPIPNQPKGKPNGKLVTTPGIISNATFVTTREDWYCKNWKQKTPVSQINS